jgi:hypothetical protein
MDVSLCVLRFLRPIRCFHRALVVSSGEQRLGASRETESRERSPESGGRSRAVRVDV